MRLGRFADTIMTTRFNGSMSALPTSDVTLTAKKIVAHALAEAIAYCNKASFLPSSTPDVQPSNPVSKLDQIREHIKNSNIIAPTAAKPRLPASVIGFADARKLMRTPSAPLPTPEPGGN